MTKQEQTLIDSALWTLHEAADTMIGEDRRRLGAIMQRLVDLQGRDGDVEAERAAWLKEAGITLAEGCY